MNRSRFGNDRRWLRRNRTHIQPECMVERDHHTAAPVLRYDRRANDKHDRTDLHEDAASAYCKQWTYVLEGAFEGLPQYVSARMVE